MGKIKKILENELIGGTQSTDVYPVTSTKAVYNENNENLDSILKRRGIINVSTNYNSTHTAETLTLEQAIDKVPLRDRVLGFTMTFLSSDGWKNYQFTGTTIDNWIDINNWTSFVNDAQLKSNQDSITEKLDTKVNTSDIVQQTGNSTTSVMSQKAVTDAIQAETARATAAEEKIVNSSSVFAENCYGRFIRELYIENNTNITDLHVWTIRRNDGQKWQFTIKGFVGEELVIITNIFSTSADVENNGITKFTHKEGDNRLIGYVLLDWSQVPSPKYDPNRYNLKDACYNIDFSPSIKSYLETLRAQEAEKAKQNILKSGANIKTINGDSILGSGNININSNIVSNIYNYNIGNINVANSLVEKKTIFGNSISIYGTLSDKLPKISIFSKPTIQVVGSDRNISFPTKFNIKINGTVKEILNINPIRSINFAVDKATTEIWDFTYSDDDGKIYISDSIEIYNDKYYFVKRIEETIWHTGDKEPELYLSNKVDGLVDGATIYIVKEQQEIEELGDIVISVNNGDVITTDISNLYLQVEEIVPKQILENPIILTKCAELADDDITVKGRNVTFDKDNDILYICAYSGKLYKIDVSNDKKPVVTGVLTVNNTSGHVCTGCVIVGDYLYAVDRNEGIAKNPSYLTVINRNTFSIIKQINLYDESEFTHNSAQSPCSCAIDERGYLIIPENSYFWAIYDIVTDPENPKLIYQQTYNSYEDKEYKEYQRVAFFSNNGKYYAIFCGFSSGFSIWDITDISTPKKIGQIKTSPLQVMDLVIKYPYLYAPCGGQIASKFSHKEACRSIIRIDLSDLSKYPLKGVHIDNIHESCVISQIPYDKFYPSIKYEGDPAPTRITTVGDFMAVNYAEAGTAVFRLINNIPVFQSCYQLAGKGNTIQPLYATEDGRLFQVNIYGTHTGMQVYRLGNVNY